MPKSVLHELARPDYSHWVDVWTQVLKEESGRETTNLQKLQTSKQLERLAKVKEKAIKPMGKAATKEIKHWLNCGQKLQLQLYMITQCPDTMVISSQNWLMWISS